MILLFGCLRASVEEDYMTLEQLQVRTRKDLAQLARQRKISGWHSMRKNDLILAIFAVEATGSNGRRHYIVSQKRSSPVVAKTHQKIESAATVGGGVREKSRSQRSVSRDTKPAKSKRVDAKSTGKVSLRKNRLHSTHSDERCGNLDQDRIEIELRDAEWLYVNWNVSARAIKRVESSLKYKIHSAIPTLRVFTVSNNELQASSRRTCVADHEISGKKSSWYIPLPEGDQTYQVSLGYKASSGEFHSIMRSNPVSTESTQRMKGDQLPTSNASSEMQTKSGGVTSQKDSSRFSSVDSSSPFVVLGGEKVFIDDNSSSCSNNELQFEMDAELVVQGIVDPGATLTLDGEPMDVDRNGRFSARYALPNGRQMISAVMVTPDQTEKRTIVMGIDRSMREMEPQRLGKKLV